MFLAFYRRIYDIACVCRCGHAICTSGTCQSNREFRCLCMCSRILNMCIAYKKEFIHILNNFIEVSSSRNIRIFTLLYKRPVTRQSYCGTDTAIRSLSLFPIEKLIANSKKKF